MTLPGFNPGLEALLARAGEAFRLRDKNLVDTLLRDAVRRAPLRTDIRAALASHYIQIHQPEEAVLAYEDTLRLLPTDTDTLFHLAHWRRHQGLVGGAEEAMTRLGRASPERAADLRRIWTIMDRWYGQSITDALPKHSRGEKIALLVLGYQLAEDGGMRRTLVDRLETAYLASRLYPDAPIVLSGGVPRGGRVEATAMRRWLEERGVARERLMEEAYSRDIVENILFSRPILDALGARRVVGITCAENIRRTGASLEIAAWAGGSTWTVDMVAASGATYEGFADDGRDSIKLYRDVLRTYGIPMMAVYPHLAER